MEYTQFDDEDRCNATLPTNPVVHIFHYHQFLGLQWNWASAIRSPDVADGIKLVNPAVYVPLVLPHWLTMPGWLPVNTRDPGTIDPLDPMLAHVTPEGGFYPGSRSLHHEAALAEPTFRVSYSNLRTGSMLLKDGEREATVELSEPEANMLRAVGRTRVSSPSDNRVYDVKVSAQEIAVRDVETFLKRGVADDAGEALRFDLSEDEHAVFARHGSVLVRHPTGGRRGHVRLYIDTSHARSITSGKAPQSTPLGAVGDALRKAVKVQAQITFYLAYAAQFQRMPRKLPHEVVFLNQYEQSWKLLGYSRGELVSSFSLAPGEQITIEVFTYDRSRREASEEITSEFEKLVELSGEVTTTVDVVRDTAVNLHASVGADVGGGLALPAGKLPVNGDVNANVDGELGGEFQNNVQETINTVVDTTLKVSNRYRASRRVRVTQTNESGREERTTRVLRNPNLSRTLNIDGFEVLGNYEVSTQLTDFAVPAVLVHMPELTFDIDFVCKYKGFIRRHLLSDEYMNGIDAIDIILANEWAELRNVPEPSVTPDDEPEGSSTPDSGSGTAEEPPEVVDTPLRRVAKRLQRSIHALSSASPDAFFEQYMTELNQDGNAWSGYKPPSDDAISAFRKWLAWENLTRTKQRDTEAMLRYLQGVTQADSSTSEKPEGRLVEDRNVLLMELEALVPDFRPGLELLITLYPGLFQTLLEPLIHVDGWKKAALFGEMAIGIYIEDFMDLDGAVEEARLQLPIFRTSLKETLELVGDVEVDTSVPGSGGSSPGSASSQNQLPLPVERPYGLKQHADAYVALECLLKHLNEHYTYYHNRFYFEERPNARYERMNVTEGDLLQFIDNRIIGFVGRRAAFPLKRNFDEQFDRYVDKLRENARKALDDRFPTMKRSATVSLPTDSVHLESRIGACDALEPYLLERRALEQAQAQAAADLAQERLEQQRQSTRRTTHEVDQLVSNGSDNGPDSADDTEPADDTDSGSPDQ